MARLVEWLRAERIAGLVIGLPRQMDGSDGDRTRSVRAQARNIATAAALPTLLWDERWSTLAVERSMLAADLSRGRRAAAVDRLAAAWILEGALMMLARVEAQGPETRG